MKTRLFLTTLALSLSLSATTWAVDKQTETAFDPGQDSVLSELNDAKALVVRVPVTPDGENTSAAEYRLVNSNQEVQDAKALPEAWAKGFDLKGSAEISKPQKDDSAGESTCGYSYCGCYYSPVVTYHSYGYSYGSYGYSYSWYYSSPVYVYPTYAYSYPSYYNSYPSYSYPSYSYNYYHSYPSYGYGSYVYYYYPYHHYRHW